MILFVTLSSVVGVVTVSSFLTVSSTTDTSISFSKEISCSV
ncbi:hypothetical protein [Faecalibacillus intestinalis]